MLALSDLHSLLSQLATAEEADALRGLGDLLRSAAPEDVRWLGGHRDRWVYCLPARPLPDGRGDDLDAPLIALATMSRDGVIRERALRLLSERGDGGELPYVILRLNDWVPEVRAVAVELAHARLSPAYAPHWLRCHALVDDLRGERRAPRRELADQIEAIVAAPGAAGVVERALDSGDRGLRRAAARVAARTGEPTTLLRLLGDGDAITATTAARAIAASFRGDALREVLPRMLRGPARVRCLGLTAASEHIAAEAEPLLRSALLDGTASVREAARHLWTRSGAPPLDFAAFYRAALGRAKGRAFAGALHGLAETGTETDAPLFALHLGDPRSEVRAAAVMGIGRCGRPADGEALLTALRDPSLRVREAARPWVRARFGRAHARLPPRG